MLAHCKQAQVWGGRAWAAGCRADPPIAASLSPMVPPCLQVGRAAAQPARGRGCLVPAAVHARDGAGARRLRLGKGLSRGEAARRGACPVGLHPLAHKVLRGRGRKRSRGIQLFPGTGYQGSWQTQAAGAQAGPRAARAAAGAQGDICQQGRQQTARNCCCQGDKQ